MKEMYFVVDVETNGQIPGDHCMLTVGCQAVIPSSHRERLMLTEQTFYVRLKDDEQKVHKPTMDWWKGIRDSGHAGREAYHEAFSYEPRYDPKSAMHRFEQWVKDVLALHHAEKAVFVASPIGFDFTWVRWYMHHYLGECLFGHRALDLSSLWMGRDLSKSQGKEGLLTYKSDAFDKTFGNGYVNPMPHNGLEDAKALANAFVNLWNATT